MFVYSVDGRGRDNPLETDGDLRCRGREEDGKKCCQHAGDVYRLPRRNTVQILMTSFSKVPYDLAKAVRGQMGLEIGGATSCDSVKQIR